MMLNLLLCCLLFICSGLADSARVISIPANGLWDGNDGPWSSFTVYVGTPPQEVRLFPSTSGSTIWAVVPVGCNTTTDPGNCTTIRGGAFDVDNSTTWVQKGIYSLPLSSERALGYTGNGQYGYDRITFPQVNGSNSNAVTMKDLTVAGIASKAFFVGSLGLAPVSLNFTAGDAIPSLMQKLKNAGYIKSMSWGYTAGSYRQSVFGSLQFGGYDKSRFIRNSLSFPMSVNPESYGLRVGIQTITTGTQNLLVNGTNATLDSTVGQLWLPLASCLSFEQAFGLIWDNTTHLYLVNEALHSSLLQKNPKVTFTLGLTPTSRDIINIEMPYSSFDLVASWPLTTNGTNRFFPLRRAANATQVTLGRPFFQHAYVVADYDRASFSVYQAVLPPADTAQNLVAIIPPKTGLSTGGIVGVVIGCVVALVIVAGGVGWWLRKKKSAVREATNRKEQDASEAFIKPELDGTETTPWRDDKKYDTQAIDLPEFEGAGSRNSMLKTDYDALREHGTDHSSAYEVVGSPQVHAFEIGGNQRALAFEAGGNPRAELVGTEAAAELPSRHPRTYYELP